MFSSDRLCRHLHLSLQSGCTGTLRRMRRPYSAEDFASLIDSVRLRVPSVAITTDIIVGFPGETDKEFEESLAFAESMSFARLHAFPYSAREGTEAAGLPDQISPAVKRQRMQRMLVVAQQSRERFELEHVDTPAKVLWEYRRQGCWYGMTDNYLRVVLETDQDLMHRITPVQLAASGPGELTCELSSPPG